MKRMISAAVILFLLDFVPCPGAAETGRQEVRLVDEFGKDAGSIDIKNVFREVPLADTSVLIEPGAVVKQVEAVLGYFKEYRERDPGVVSAGIFSRLGITFADVEATLRFIKAVIDEDEKKGTACRLEDPRFLSKHFRVYQWSPCGSGEETARGIRITKYAVFTIPGSLKRDSVYQYTLYALPHDEQGMSLEEAEDRRQGLSRFRYTKQQVLAGVYDKGGAEPLVWVTRKGLEEALMEGTVCVRLTDGGVRYFNVNRSNGIPYDPGIRNPWDQRRYWYFGRADGPRGYGMDIGSQIRLYSGGAVAGDVYNLGLGKLVGILYRDNSGKGKMRLSILADTGGAFSPNLYKLDYYCGVFESREEFRKKAVILPGFARVYILVKKGVRGKG